MQAQATRVGPENSFKRKLNHQAIGRMFAAPKLSRSTGASIAMMGNVGVARCGSGVRQIAPWPHRSPAGWHRQATSALHCRAGSWSSRAVIQ